MGKLIDRLPLTFLVLGALFLGTAPLPEPHLVEKLRMLFAGTLAKPIDIFDLVMHAALPLLLVIKLARLALVRRGVSERPEPPE